uniref:Mitochondrial carrier protein n=1 Tax=Octactis speculum TaxID=3111310 RepID=A0A7S2CPY6_9STRA|mmetsp:Transcript_38626/g.52366  ORF Transcript_38626/g.52366 Transcript_38626/m.52366 type:complete len:136 (+) Transcript_38626:29-436(+)
MAQDKLRSVEITRRKTESYIESPDVAKASSEVQTAISLPVRMVVSAVGGMVGATVCHPIDVVRINMQVFKYNGISNAVTSIVKRSGFLGGLYPGLDGAYLRQWTYGSCRMGIYSFLQDKVWFLPSLNPFAVRVRP